MITKGMLSSTTDEWETPQKLFDELDAVYGFTLDPCSSDENAKCKKHYTKADDGLKRSCGGETVFMNPPYGRRIGEWVRKAYTESRQKETTVVCLLPARTDTKWFHDYCLRGKVEFIKGRLHFNDSERAAPFPSMVVVFEGREDEQANALVSVHRDRRP